MNKIIKDKMKRKIMVVANKFLFKGIKMESKFYNNSEVDFEKAILENYEYMIRGEAEVNFDYKQPIGYAAVINEKKEIFVYKR
jgi:predicted NUDIX family phosphoesterase